MTCICPACWITNY